MQPLLHAQHDNEKLIELRVATNFELSLKIKMDLEWYFGCKEGDDDYASKVESDYDFLSDADSCLSSSQSDIASNSDTYDSSSDDDSGEFQFAENCSHFICVWNAYLRQPALQRISLLYPQVMSHKVRVKRIVACPSEMMARRCGIMAHLVWACPHVLIHSLNSWMKCKSIYFTGLFKFK